MAMKRSDGSRADASLALAEEEDNIRITAAPFPIEPENVVVSYDGDLDTLMIYLYGRGRPSMVVEIGDSQFALVDPERHYLLGFQIEDFAAIQVHRQPDLVEFLEHAELRDMTQDDVRALRREVLGYLGRFRLWVRRIWFRAIPHRGSDGFKVAQRVIRDQRDCIPSVSFA